MDMEQANKQHLSTSAQRSTAHLARCAKHKLPKHNTQALKTEEGHILGVVQHCCNTCCNNVGNHVQMVPSTYDEQVTRLQH